VWLFFLNTGYTEKKRRLQITKDTDIICNLYIASAVSQENHSFLLIVYGSFRKQ